MPLQDVVPEVLAEHCAYRFKSRSLSPKLTRTQKKEGVDMAVIVRLTKFYELNVCNLKMALN